MDSWDWPQFLNDIRQLYAWSNRFDDGWQLVSPLHGEEGSTYIRKQFKCSQILAPPTRTTTDADAFVEANDPCRCPDEHNDTNQPNQLVIAYDFHVLFHRSYRVPVLCFNGYKPDGTLLTLDEAWRLFNDTTGTTTTSAMPAVLTEMDHPMLFTPFHTLHPCRTAELLGAIGGGGNRVLSFLSTLGPYVNLHMDLRYGQLLVGHEPTPSTIAK